MADLVYILSFSMKSSIVLRCYYCPFFSHWTKWCSVNKSTNNLIDDAWENHYRLFLPTVAWADEEGPAPQDGEGNHWYSVRDVPWWWWYLFPSVGSWPSSARTASCKISDTFIDFLVAAQRTMIMPNLFSTLFIFFLFFSFSFLGVGGFLYIFIYFIHLFFIFSLYVQISLLKFWLHFKCKCLQRKDFFCFFCLNPSVHLFSFPIFCYYYYYLFVL